MNGWSDDANAATLASVNVCGTQLHAGDRVRLCPQKAADILDIALTGKTAVIESIEQDFEDRVYLAVILEEDPGGDFGMLRLPAHRFFFSPADVEPVTAAPAATPAPAEEDHDG